MANVYDEFERVQEYRHSRRQSAASIVSACALEDSPADSPTDSPASSRDSSRRPSMVSFALGPAEDLSDQRAKELWKCMLELQKEYHCYNSARMQVASEASDGGMSLMPTHFILDVLNESAIGTLPEEGRQRLYRCLLRGEKKEKRGGCGPAC